jgi:hypothetical protein
MPLVNLMLTRRTAVLAALTAVLVLAAVLRLVALDRAPVGGQGDTAWIGINALDWIDRGVWPFYVRELYSPEFFPVLAAGGFVSVFGIPTAVSAYLPQRVFTAFTGIAFVALLFPAAVWLLARAGRETQVRAGLWAALAGAASLHIVFIQRLGMESPPFLASLTLLIALTARAWALSERAAAAGGPVPWRAWVLAGVVLGINQYIYLPARLLPVVFVGWIALGWLMNRRTAFVRGWLAMAAASFIVTLPALALFAALPESFSGRADSGTAATGGWAWLYDTSAVGGLFGLFAAKTVLMLEAIGLRFVGAYTAHGLYTVVGAPIFSPIPALGVFIGAVGGLFAPRVRLASAWLLAAALVLFTTDLISGALPELHALHGMGVLPPLALLAGVGLALADDARARCLPARVNAAVSVVLAAAVVLPAVTGMAEYLGRTVPAQEAAPEVLWQRAQADVLLARAIAAEPERAYLLPYSEYIRPDVAWGIAAAYRDRASALTTAQAAEGRLNVRTPAVLTVITPADPARPRHDGFPPQPDPRAWVLLEPAAQPGGRGTVRLLPPLSADAAQRLAVALETAPAARRETLSHRISGHSAVDEQSATDASYAPYAPYEPYATWSAIDDADLIAALFALPLENPAGGCERPVESGGAVFEGGLRLIGTTLTLPGSSTGDLTPGTRGHVALCWQVETPPPFDYEVFAQVWDARGTAVAAAHEYPFSGMYRARIWRPGEIVVTLHPLVLPDTLAAGRYTLAVGLFRYLANTRVPVVSAPPLGYALDGQVGGMVYLGGLRRPPEARAAQPALVSPVTFADAGRPVLDPVLALQGAALAVEGPGAAAPVIVSAPGDATLVMRPGDALTLTLDWAALARPSADYAVFVHVAASADVPPSAQYDGPLGLGFPTGTWRAGERWSGAALGPVRLLLPPDLATGVYDVYVGVYDPATGGRLNAAGAGARPDGRVLLARLAVE